MLIEPAATDGIQLIVWCKMASIRVRDEAPGLCYYFVGFFNCKLLKRYREKCQAKSGCWLVVSGD